MIERRFTQQSRNKKNMQGSGIDEYTVLMLHCEDFTDSSLNPKTIHMPNEIWVVDNGVFSNCWDAEQGHYLYIDHNDDFDFGTGDFTVDFWLYSYNRDWNSSQLTGIVAKQKSNDSSNGWKIFRSESFPTKLTVRIGSNEFPSNSSPLCNTWEHWALVRNESIIKWYKNGKLDATGECNVDISDPAKYYMFANVEDWSWVNHINIDEFRISKGVARWKDEFVPPVAPYSK